MIRDTQVYSKAGATVVLAAVALVSLLYFGRPAEAIAPQPVSPQASGVGLSVKHTLSAASTNSTLVAAGAHVLYGVNAFNTNATTQYLKFYNKATAPTCGTDTPVLTIPLVQNVIPTIPSVIKDFGISFSLGIGICSTGAIADSDTTNATTGATLDVVYH